MHYNDVNFYSPNYPGNYPNYKDCSWLIEAPVGHYIYLSIYEFNLEGGSSCPFDFLDIYDGNSSSSPLIIRACGYRSPWSLYSSSRFFYLRFRTDSSVIDSGFAAFCRATSQSKANTALLIYPIAVEIPQIPRPYHKTYSIVNEAIKIS